MRKNSLLFLLAGCLLITSGCEKIELNKDKDDHTDSTTLVTTTNAPTGQKSGCYATYKNYIDIYAEMTYQDVVRIIGCDGVLQTDAMVNGDHKTYYYWYGKNNDQILAISFTNNIVDAYTQSNLDRGVDTSLYEKTTKKIEEDMEDTELSDAEKKALGIE